MSINLVSLLFQPTAWKIAMDILAKESHAQLDHTHEQRRRRDRRCIVPQVDVKDAES